MLLARVHEHWWPSKSRSGLKNTFYDWENPKQSYGTKSCGWRFCQNWWSNGWKQLFWKLKLAEFVDPSSMSTQESRLEKFGFFFKKNGPFPAPFCLFSFFSYNFNTNWKKRRWCAWDLNPGPQDGWGRRNHWAMAATQRFEKFVVENEKNSPVHWIFDDVIEIIVSRVTGLGYLWRVLGTNFLSKVAQL